MWRPASPFPSEPFCCARPARSTSSAIGFKQQQQDWRSANHVAFPKLPSPCLVARAGRKHLPVVAPKPHTRRSVTKVPTFGPRKSVRSTGPVGGMRGALVLNLTCDVRRVAKLPSEPRGDAYQIRQAKYVDSSHSNTRTSQGALGQGVSALQNTLVQRHCEILPYPCPTWSRAPYLSHPSFPPQSARVETI